MCIGQEVSLPTITMKKSIGKYFHFLINILGQILPLETGRMPMA